MRDKGPFEVSEPNRSSPFQPTLEHQLDHENRINAARRSGWHPPVRWALALVALFYLITLAIMPKDGLWVIDNAHRLWITQSIIRSGYTSFSIPWPGATLDPKLEYLPLVPPLVAFREGRVYSSYPPLFSALSAPFYQMFGPVGLSILPLLGSLLTLLGVAKVGARLGLTQSGQAAAILLAGLATPLWFYSSQFWEHSLDLCLIVWALFLLLKFLQGHHPAPFFLSAIAIAASVYLRGENYLLCALFVALTMLHFHTRKLKLGLILAFAMGLTLVPLWTFNLLATGHLMGFHMSNHNPLQEGFRQHLFERFSVFYRLLGAASQKPWESVLLMLPFLGLFLFYPHFSRRTFRWLFPAVAALAAIASAAVLMEGLRTENHRLWMIHVNSLFPVSPIIVLGLIGCRSAGTERIRWRRLVWALVLAFSFLYALICPEVASNGLHWGNRFLLLAYPLLAILAVCNFEEWRRLDGPPRSWAKLSLALVVGVSLVFQVYSIYFLYSKTQLDQRVNRLLGQYPEKVIVSDRMWFPFNAAQHFFDRQMFTLPPGQALDPLRRKLAAAGVSRFLFVTPQVQFSPDLQLLANVPDRGLDSFGIRIYRVRASPGPN